MPDVHVFHAGTARRDDDVVTDGGRVVTVVGSGHDFETAIACAYAAAGRIAFDGMHLRHDIGHKALGTASGHRRADDHA
jgi:phosphoribosylamine--glycine ligase